MIITLEKAGYQGWYVLEQDKVLREDPPPLHGPIEDASISVHYLQDLARLTGETTD